MWGAAPHPDYGERNICASPPRAPTVRLFICGVSPRTLTGGGMGIAHTPTEVGYIPPRELILGKKRPKNPKKPNCGGFILSSIDSEQGCHTAALFLCSARTVRAATVPTPVRTRIRRAYIACTRIARAPATPPVSSLRTTAHPTEALKQQTFSFYHSISDFVVSLPNLSKET